MALRRRIAAAPARPAPKIESVMGSGTPVVVDPFDSFTVTLIAPESLNQPNPSTVPRKSSVAPVGAVKVAAEIPPRVPSPMKKICWSPGVVVGLEKSRSTVAGLTVGSDEVRKTPTPYMFANEKTLMIGENPKGALFDLSTVSQV